VAAPTLLIDYSSLLHRAFHSMPETLAMHAVYGFLNMLARLLLDHRPRALAIAVDDDWRPAFRVAALPSYKAHRDATEDAVEDPVAPQEAAGRAVLRGLGFAVIGAAGFEADDVIATLAEHCRGAVAIVSGDRDLFALVRDPDRFVLYPRTGVSKLAVVDEAEVARRYGIPGRAYGDFALLRGDPSDGLPGVRGIGAKTAARLLARYGSLAAILAAGDLSPAVARKLDAGREYLAVAARVVPPVTDVPLAAMPLVLPAAPADPEALAALVAAYDLASPVERVRQALARIRAAGDQPPLPADS
jgi:5'-3' exonuclease